MESEKKMCGSMLTVTRRFAAGIDVSDDAVRVAVVSRRLRPDSAVCVEHLDAVPLAAGAVVAGDFLDRDAVAAALRTVVSRLPHSQRAAVAANRTGRRAPDDSRQRSVQHARTERARRGGTRDRHRARRAGDRLVDPGGRQRLRARVDRGHRAPSCRGARRNGGERGHRAVGHRRGSGVRSARDAPCRRLGTRRRRALSRLLAGARGAACVARAGGRREARRALSGSGVPGHDRRAARSRRRRRNPRADAFVIDPFGQADVDGFARGADLLLAGTFVGRHRTMALVQSGPGVDGFMPGQRIGDESLHRAELVRGDGAFRLLTLAEDRR